VPSAEQADKWRRRRAEDRIPQIAQDRIGLLTVTVRNKALHNLGLQDRGSHHPRTREQQSAPRSEGHKIDCGGPDLAVYGNH
jgi:hypothetical protein